MSEPQKKPWAPRIFFCLGIACVIFLIYLIWPGRNYYFLSGLYRPMHAYHKFLRSSGRGGLTFGVVGTVLMFLNLTYLIRRHFVHHEWAGSLISWMSFHVFTGLIGPLLILTHSTFLLRSPAASMAFLAMTIVVTTGVVGRYIYAHTPRSVQGKELELAELQKRIGVYRADLQELGLPMDLDMFERKIPGESEAESGGLGSVLISFVKDDLEESKEYRKLREFVQDAPALRPTAKKILDLGAEYYRELRWLQRYHELRSFMRSWRFFHRWFAIVMLILAGVHIFVAVDMGDLWLVQYLRHLGPMR